LLTAVFWTVLWGPAGLINTPFDEPFSFQIAEMFKITNGKIR